MTPDFKNRLSRLDESFVKRTKLEILQVNLGNRCNQKCAHCHVNASPLGEKLMPKEVIDVILHFLRQLAVPVILDVTGGCPELCPDFKYFIREAAVCTNQILVRNNLTVLLEPEMRDLPEFYRKHRIKLVCSMPCYTRDNVDQQRGSGVFEKSIRALKLLNAEGFGRQSRFQLDLVYNPGGAFLPADQQSLEKDYKKTLFERYGIVFNRLITITNAPINRFKNYLQANGELEKYTGLLVENFNDLVAPNVMCRNLLSVGWDGKVYDCDFNQALGLELKDRHGLPVKIKDLDPAELEGREIIFGAHCYSCTAGAGSSCQGALKDRRCA